MKTKRLLSFVLAVVMLFSISSIAFADGTDYTVTVTPCVGGTATASVASCQAGTAVTLNASAAYGYRFMGWTVSGVKLDNADHTITTFTMPASNVTVTATFAKTYTVSAVTEGGGTVEYLPQNPVAGERVNITATPMDGYTFYIWSDIGTTPVTITTPTYYATNFIMPAGNVNIKATFYKAGEDGAGDAPIIAPAPSGGTFNDVNTSDWFYNDVNYVYEKSLMNGTSDTTFSPKASLTRAMLVTVLYRLAGSPTVSEASGFADVSANSWYANAVSWAKANNIVNGISSTQFAPNNEISREQIATILYRYAQSKYYNMDVANSDIMKYEDFYSISSYAYDGLYWASGNGIITGTSGYLRPQNNATRAEISAILHRFCEKYAG